MDIKSDQFTEEVVTDLIIGFPSGAMKDFVLHSADVLRDEHHQLTITLENLGMPFSEKIIFFKSHVAWYSQMKRVLRRAISPGTKIADKS